MLPVTKLYEWDEQNREIVEHKVKLRGSNYHQIFQDGPKEVLGKKLAAIWDVRRRDEKGWHWGNFFEERAYLIEFWLSKIDDKIKSSEHQIEEAKKQSKDNKLEKIALEKLLAEIS